jgi:hypothetical protein
MNGCLKLIEIVPFDHGSDDFLVEINGAREADGYFTS